MTNKEILDEVYNRLLLVKELMRNHPMCAAKEEVLNAISFTEQEWQKADEEKESYDMKVL